MILSKMTCHGTTKAGRPCRNPERRDSLYCYLHGKNDDNVPLLTTRLVRSTRTVGKEPVTSSDNDDICSSETEVTPQRKRLNIQKTDYRLMAMSSPSVSMIDVDTIPKHDPSKPEIGISRRLATPSSFKDPTFLAYARQLSASKNIISANATRARVVNVKGDGFCFWRALSVIIHGDENDYREILTNVMVHKKDDQEVSESWVGLDEICIVAQILKQNITVILIHEFEPCVYFFSSDGTIDMHKYESLDLSRGPCIFFTGNHYLAIVETSDSDPIWKRTWDRFLDDRKYTISLNHRETRPHYYGR